MSKSIWFVTGASRGFGSLVTEHALARGDAVAATARDPRKLTHRFRDHPDLLVLALDVTDEPQARDAAAAAIARFGRIDVLLNNAGFGLMGAVEEASAAEVEAVYRTNVFGMLNVTRAVLPYMREARSGRILNVSSIGGYRGAAGFGVYCSTKFAVEGLSEALHDELAPLGIHVTVIEPGYFRTDFLDASSLAVSPTIIADYEATAGRVRRMSAGLSHNQPGDPSRLAKVLVALADVPNPPIRLPLGSDTVAAIEEKHASDAAIVAAWRDVAVSTDFQRVEDMVAANGRIRS
jgi:NAD(P)-dependent dehydrogenase (short-subunit alcohol dehydrogenase family)